MMPNMNMVESVNSAIDTMLSKDEDVIMFGEDVGYFGGVFRTSDGLQERHGKHRVFDSPLSEGGIAATAFGMGINGLRPVVEIQFEHTAVTIQDFKARFTIAHTVITNYPGSDM